MRFLFAILILGLSSPTALVASQGAGGCTGILTELASAADFKEELPQLTPSMTPKEVRAEKVRASYGTYLYGSSRIFATDSIDPLTRTITRFDLDYVIPREEGMLNLKEEVKGKYLKFWKVLRLLKDGLWGHSQDSLTVRRGHSTLTLKREDLSGSSGPVQILWIHIKADSGKNISNLESRFNDFVSKIHRETDPHFRVTILRLSDSEITFSISDGNFSEDNLNLIRFLGI